MHLDSAWSRATLIASTGPIDTDVAEKPAVPDTNAASNTLWLVFLSRIIDGLTAGNLSLAQAYIADITAPENRARSFGVAATLRGETRTSAAVVDDLSDGCASLDVAVYGEAIAPQHVERFEMGFGGHAFYRPKRIGK